MSMVYLLFPGLAFWVAGVDLYNVLGIGQYWLYSGQNISKSFFGAGEPNGHDSATRGAETCIDIKIPYHNPCQGYVLNDEVCREELSYICQEINGVPNIG